MLTKIAFSTKACVISVNAYFKYDTCYISVIIYVIFEEIALKI